MLLAVRIVASVGDHAHSLAETVESFREVGDLAVYHVGAAGAVAKSAADLGVPLIEIEDSDDDGAAMTRILADDPDRTRLVVHADEVVEQGPSPAELAALAAPATAVVLHRVNDTDSYTEELQVRLVPPGAGYTFTGRYSPRVRRHGVVLGPEAIVASGLIIGHYPARRPQLALDHVRRAIRRVERAFEEEPDDAGHLYQLIFWHWTLNGWDDVLRLLPRWRELAPAAGHELALVDYFAACASLGRRDVAGARRLVSSALRRSDRFADAWFLEGELHRLARDPRRAAEAFARAAALGADASPVAVEDHSLGTWRPLLELARLAEAEGRADAAADLRRRAEAARGLAASLPGGHAGPPA